MITFVIVTLYVSTEDGEMATSVWLNKYFGQEKSKDDILSRLNFIFSTDGIISNLRDAVKNNCIDLIIVDSYADLFTGSMNNSNEVRGFLNQYDNLVKEFGLDYDYEVDYRSLQKKFKREELGDWVIMPIVPFDPYEMDYANEESTGFSPPSWKTGHFCGTDKTERDVFARLLYGFRIAMTFSLGYLFLTYLIAIGAGSVMGYFGGKTDMIGLRLVEIWANVPFLYTIPSFAPSNDSALTNSLGSQSGSLIASKICKSNPDGFSNSSCL